MNGLLALEKPDRLCLYVMGDGAFGMSGLIDVFVAASVGVAQPE